MKGWIVLILLSVLLLTACSVQKLNQTSTVKGDYGMLKLVGDPEGREVSLDGQVITLNPKEKVNIFELKVGTYRLEIRSQDKVLLSQNLFITISQTNEVKMP